MGNTGRLHRSEYADEVISSREMGVVVQIATKRITFTGPCGQRWKMSFEDWGYLQAAVEAKAEEAIENARKYETLKPSLPVLFDLRSPMPLPGFAERPAVFGLRYHLGLRPENKPQPHFPFGQVAGLCGSALQLCVPTSWSDADILAFTASQEGLGRSRSISDDRPYRLRPDDGKREVCAERREIDCMHVWVDPEEATS